MYFKVNDIVKLPETEVIGEVTRISKDDSTPYGVFFSHSNYFNWYAENELELVNTADGDEVIELDLPVELIEYLEEEAKKDNSTTDAVVNKIIKNELDKCNSDKTYRDTLINKLKDRLSAVDSSVPSPQPISSKEEKMCNHLKVLKQYARYNGVREYEANGRYKVISKGIPMGVLLASYDSVNDRVVIGWSLAHSKKDVFDKNTGTGLAFQRMSYGRVCRTEEIPNSIRDQVRDFAVKATKYYQTVNCVVCI